MSPPVFIFIQEEQKRSAKDLTFDPYVQPQTHQHSCIGTSTHVYTYVYIYMYIHMHIDIYIYTCNHICMYVFHIHMR